MKVLLYLMSATFGLCSTLYWYLVSNCEKPWVRDHFDPIMYQPIYGYGIVVYFAIVSVGAAALLHFMPAQPTADISREAGRMLAGKDAEKRLLLFKDQASFDEWHTQVKFRLGLPSYSRSLSTDEVRTDVTRTLTYTRNKRLSGGKDPRVICTFDEQVPPELVNSEAQERYNFTKVSFRQAEEIGFFSDSLELISEKTKEFEAGVGGKRIDDREEAVRKVFTPDSGISFDLFLKLGFVSESRNQYIVDFGIAPNQDRISLFVDRENTLCFRLIDHERRSYILRVRIQEATEFFHLHCKYHQDSKYLKAVINGKEVGKLVLPEETVFEVGPQVLTIGANLRGEYNGKFSLAYISILRVLKGMVHVVYRDDALNKDTVFVRDGRWISEIKSK